MMHKLIQHIAIQITMIGLKGTSVLIIVFLSSCGLFEWDKQGLQQTSYIKNATNDKIRVVIGSNEVYKRLDEIVFPNERVIYEGGRDVFDEDRILEKNLFDNEYNDETQLVQVYVYNELIIQWRGPAQDRGDTNHFYNYNSWTVEKKNNEYELEFTIYDSDLNQQ